MKRALRAAVRGVAVLVVPAALAAGAAQAGDAPGPARSAATGPSAMAAGATQAVVAAQVAAPAAGVVTDAAGLADASADFSMAAAWIPDSSKRVGEVRLVKRGDAVVAQTLLETRLLGRVVAEIRAKERRNWGEAEPSSARYLESLAAVQGELDRRGEARADDDRRRRMLVEFVAGPAAAAVLVGTFDPAPGAATLAPASREVMQRLELPRDYVLRNLRLILADSFDVDEAGVDRLGDLGPAARRAAP